MKRFTAAVSTLLFGLGFSLEPLAEISVRDDLGNNLVLEQPARRIISLAPNITEVLFYIGAGEQIVGADEYSNYPAAAQQIPRVNNHAAANYELILSLQPDVVIAWQSGNGEKIIKRIRQLGIPVFVVETRTMEDIPRLFSRFGALTGHADFAQSRAADFTRRLNALREEYSAKPKIRTFYQIWDEPLITLNGEHIVSDVIELCGGSNIFADAVPLVPYVNIESIVAADPQVIIAGGSKEEKPHWFDNWSRWSQISAVENDHVYLIHADLMQRHSGRILDGAAMMCDFLNRARQSLPREVIDGQ
jgi:iron complex transport system substrate-binding protein